MSRARSGASALEEQRSEKYRHALIAVVSIGVRAGQLGGPAAWLSSPWYLEQEYLGRDQTCDLQELQVAPLTVPLFLKGHILQAEGAPNLTQGRCVTGSSYVFFPSVACVPARRQQATRPPREVIPGMRKHRPGRCPARSISPSS